VAYEIIAPVVTFAVLLVCAWFLGGFMVKVFKGERTFLHRVLRPVERGIYKVTGIDEEKEQSWKGYLVALMLVTVLSLVFTYVILRYQDKLPFQSQLNPAGQSGVPADLSLNTAISFTTNTNWQNYTGESTMSYLSQMLALAFHQFLSAATGIALAIALVRGIARHTAKTIGNFYVDITRATVYILIPLSLIATIIFVANGSIQNFSQYTNASGLGKIGQVIAQGPVASMEAIKDVGNNGGGYFNANSAHPFENPNGFTSAFIIFLMLLIPFALFITYGKWVGKVRQGIVLFSAAAVLLFTGMGIAAYYEQAGNPAITTGATQAMSSTQSGGNMEGKSVRFGSVESALFGTVTTGTSTGSVISSHDSWTPLGGMVPLVLIQLGEIAPGGIGAGLYSIVVFAILSVFIAGLMVGRTPEYLGKKIEGRDVKYAALSILVVPAVILGFTAWAVLAARGQANPLYPGTGPSNPGPHGFTEILYGYSSTEGNNGSAFAGLSGNNLFYNTTLGASMWIGRFMEIIPILALAGSLAKKKLVPASAGTFPTDRPLFVGLLVGVILIVGALTFLPALALGPILEHLQLPHAATSFVGAH
jgi:K+-transporting ATPase ATPase A chain